MKERWAMLAIGMWICGTLIVSFVAAENFFTVDRLLTGSMNSTFPILVGKLGQPQSRDLLRYLSSELNRLYFQAWNVMQFVIGALILWLIARNPAATKARWGIVVMLAVVVLMMVWLTPEITALGRSLDFVPRDPPPPSMHRFWILHGTYTILEIGKLIVAVIVAIWISRSTPSRKVANQ